MMSYIYILISVILLAVQFMLNKKYQSIVGHTLKTGLVFNMLSGLTTGIVFFAACGFKISLTPFSVILAMLTTALTTSYTIFGFKLLKGGQVASYSLFLMTGGMVLPYIFGILFLNEQLTILRVVGLLLILMSVIMSNFDKGVMKRSVFALGMLIFVLNGGVSIFSKLHQIESFYPTVGTTEFVVISGFVKFILCGTALLFVKDEQKVKVKASLKIVVLAAIISGISYILQLIGAKSIPASVLYPMITGGSIIFSSILGRLVYKEKLSRKMLFCIIAIFAGTCMFI